MKPISIEDVKTPTSLYSIRFNTVLYWQRRDTSFVINARGMKVFVNRLGQGHASFFLGQWRFSREAEQSIHHLSSNLSLYVTK